MRRLFLGIDTSNYKTSAAVFCPEDGSFRQCGRLLEVPEGTLGLRQSDALFQHVRQLPEQVEQACRALEGRVAGVGYSSRPRDLEDSYMPCFLAGECAARCMAAALGVSARAFSHQQGHLAAAAFSVGKPELLRQPFLAWHLSGGTTELLLVEPEGKNVRCKRIGGTTDISAGQLIDRTGVLLGLPFPAGKHLDALSAQAEKQDFYPVKCTGMEFSLSGMQNQVAKFAESNTPADTAAFALGTMCSAVLKATRNAQKKYPGLQIVFSGGVASNSMLRERTKPLDPVFAQPQYSTDNAMGVAVLTRRLAEDQ